jgi:S-formylglutathione hydrolase FrmB
MALLTINWMAPSIGQNTSMNVLLPESSKPLPVLYLLHGMSDSYQSWLRLSAIEWNVYQLPLIIVMPDGGRSFYCNDPRPGGAAYEDHIVKDVVGYIDRTFNTIPARRGRAIAGLSMGGYGAIMLALRHPELFSVAGGHSSALGFHNPKLSRWKELQVGKDGDYDLFQLARRFVRSGKKLALRFDCGVDDFLIGHNRSFHAHLAKIGLPHIYQENPGGHDWGYFGGHIPDTLAFVKRHLIEKKGK